MSGGMSLTGPVVTGPVVFVCSGMSPTGPVVCLSVVE